MKRIRPSYIFLACYLSYCAIYVARLNLSMTTPVLSELGFFSVAEIGLLGGVFSVVYAIGRLVSGMIGDSAKPWIVISLGLAVTGISNILFGFFPPLWGCIVLWSANAFAQSMLWGVILKIISCVYPKEIAGRKASIMVTSVTTGNMLSIVASAFLANRFGPAAAFMIPGGITLICCFLIVLTTKNVECSAVTKPQGFPMFQLLRKKEIRSAIYPAFLHGINKDNISFWMVAFFAMHFGIHLEGSSYFVLFIPTVGFVGRTVYPLLYRIFRQKEHFVSSAAFTVAIISIIILLLSPRSALTAMVCLGVLYASVSVVNTSFLSIMPLRYTADNHVASVSGIMDFSTYLGASLGSFVYGYVIDHIGYAPVFFSWLIISVFAIVLLIRLGRQV